MAKVCGDQAGAVKEKKQQLDKVAEEMMAMTVKGGKADMGEQHKSIDEALATEIRELDNQLDALTPSHEVEIENEKGKVGDLQSSMRSQSMAVKKSIMAEKWEHMQVTKGTPISDEGRRQKELYDQGKQKMTSYNDGGWSYEKVPKEEYAERKEEEKKKK